MIRRCYFFIIIGILFFTNCATIFNRVNYPVLLETNPEEAKINITDKQGLIIYQGYTPTYLELDKGTKKDYYLKLEKQGYETKLSHLSFKSNHLFLFLDIMTLIMGPGLFLPILIDYSTGAIYDLNTELLDTKLVERDEFNVLSFNMRKLSKTKKQPKLNNRIYNNDQVVKAPKQTRLNDRNYNINKRYKIKKQPISNYKNKSSLIIKLSYFESFYNNYASGGKLEVQYIHSILEYYSLGIAIGRFFDLEKRIMEFSLVQRINFNRWLCLNLNLGYGTFDTQRKIFNGHFMEKEELPAPYSIDIEPAVYIHKRLGFTLGYRYQLYDKGSSYFRVGLFYDL